MLVGPEGPRDYCVEVEAPAHQLGFLAGHGQKAAHCNTKSKTHGISAVVIPTATHKHEDGSEVAEGTV